MILQASLQTTGPHAGPGVSYVREDDTPAEGLVTSARLVDGGSGTVGVDDWCVSSAQWIDLELGEAVFSGEDCMAAMSRSVSELMTRDRLV
jgi:hypothetical protein